MSVALATAVFEVSNGNLGYFYVGLDLKIIQILINHQYFRME